MMFVMGLNGVGSGYIKQWSDIMNFTIGRTVICYHWLWKINSHFRLKCAFHHWQNPFYLSFAQKWHTHVIVNTIYLTKLRNAIFCFIVLIFPKRNLVHIKVVPMLFQNGRGQAKEARTHYNHLKGVNSRQWHPWLWWCKFLLFSIILSSMIIQWVIVLFCDLDDSRLYSC